MKHYTTYRATNAEEATLHINLELGLSSSGFDYHTQRKMFQEAAASLADVLCSHLPQGLVDHLFAELAGRKASLLTVKEREDDAL